jgi:hypothetical protein
MAKEEENDKRTNNDLQNTIQKAKDRTTRVPLAIGRELGCSGWVSRSCSTTYYIIDIIGLNASFREFMHV